MDGDHTSGQANDGSHLDEPEDLPAELLQVLEELGVAYGVLPDAPPAHPHVSSHTNPCAPPAAYASQQDQHTTIGMNDDECTITEIWLVPASETALDALPDQALIHLATLQSWYEDINVFATLLARFKAQTT